MIYQRRWWYKRKRNFGGPKYRQTLYFSSAQITRGHWVATQVCLSPTTRLPSTRRSWHKKRYIYRDTHLPASPSPCPRPMPLPLLLIALTSCLIDRENQGLRLSARHCRACSGPARCGVRCLATRRSCYTP